MEKINGWPEESAVGGIQDANVLLAKEKTFLQ
jgi:hypothetical protein